MSFLLLDTHLLLWSVLDDDHLSTTARASIDDATHALAFSAASIREVAIKAGTKRGEGLADPRRLRRTLLDNG